MAESPLSAVPTLTFSSMSDDEVKESLRTYRIGLTTDEARKIESLLGRPPTVVEAVIWGIQGSEHSSYKSSRRFLKLFPTSGKHVILGPREDSGIVAMTDGPAGERWGVVISHESHNHPSQIVPYEGAATGVGGTVRDVLCMGARVVGCMDLLRLGDLKSEETRSIAKEVARGIAGYGNPLGVPNLGGDTVFDSAFNTNCLVNAVGLGIIREDEIIHSYVPKDAGKVGYDIILYGKPTDRSGFGGAAFASISMEKEKIEQNAGAVQEPNPFLERHLLASTYALFDWLVTEKHLDKVSLKDLGAGGVVCATVEQVSEAGYGADVSLDLVHVSIPDLPPEVIACAETQERFCWMCHPSLTEHILRHYNQVWDLPSVAEGACASVIGKVNDSGIFRLTHKGRIVCEAKSEDITSGLLYERPTASVDFAGLEPEITCTESSITVSAPLPSPFETSITDVFKRMISHPNHASKSPITLHYDKNVIGNTVIEAGEADATVIAPLQDLESYSMGSARPFYSLSDAELFTGIALAGDGNARYGRISAFAQGRMAAIESICNVAAVGATPRALSDCLNYGNPEKPEQLGALEDGVRGIAEAARGVTIDGEGVPVISGNVSLYNSTPDGNAIPPMAIVSCIGILSDARKAVNQQIKKDGSALILLGARKNECGGSAYYEILEQMSHADRDALLGKNVPDPDLKELSSMISFLRKNIADENILACHDISDGGLLLALFEMLLPQRKVGGTLGLSVDLDTLRSDLRSDTLLFSQSSGFLIEVPPVALEKIMASLVTFSIPFFVCGTVTSHPTLTISRKKAVIFSESLVALRDEWENGLEKIL